VADEKKRKRGRPRRPMPERIDDAPENVAKALLETPPKRKQDWKYLKAESED